MVPARLPAEKVSAPSGDVPEGSLPPPILPYQNGILNDGLPWRGSSGSSTSCVCPSASNRYALLQGWARLREDAMTRHATVNASGLRAILYARRKGISWA